MNPLDACAEHHAGRDCKIHGPLENTPATALRGVASSDPYDRGGTMPPMTLPELQQTLTGVIDRYNRWPGSISASDIHELERGLKLLDQLLGSPSQQGLKAA